MPTAKLTKRTVEMLEAPAEKQAILWDSEIRSFGVRVMPSGLKTFVVQYRNSEGTKRRINLGRFGIITIEQARDLAKVRLGAVAAGEDPAQTRPNGSTVNEVCDWYLEEAEAGRLLGRRRKPIASSTLALDRSRTERHVKPLIGNRSVEKLSIADLERFQADIKDGKTAKERDGRGGITSGGAGVAGRTVGMLHTIFEQAARWKVIEANPARGVRKIPIDVKRDRRLSVDEMTGCVRFPDTKTGPQVRPVGVAALAHIHSQPKRESCDYVFPSGFSEGHLVGLPRILQRVCTSAGIEGATLHTLRHTFASIAGELGFSELTICVLLGHAPRGITQRYVHIDNATKLAANEVSKAIAEDYLGPR